MGLAQMANGNQYQGMWANGIPHGEGHMVLANGDQYQGEWVHGNMEGNVRVALVSGDQYQGEWTHNEPHGQGLYVSADGFSYEGDWVDGRRHGQGQYVEANGDWYEGEWRADQPAGVGQQRVTIGGDVYTGATLDGKRHGQGQYVYANGNWYQGDWVQGQRTGQGTLQLSNGDWYQGEWFMGNNMVMADTNSPAEVGMKAAGNRAKSQVVAAITSLKPEKRLRAFGSKASRLNDACHGQVHASILIHRSHPPILLSTFRFTRDNNRRGSDLEHSSDATPSSPGGGEAVWRGSDLDWVTVDSGSGGADDSDADGSTVSSSVASA